MSLDEMLWIDNLKMQRRRKIASYTFIAAAGVLYATNIIMRAAVHHDSVWKLLRDFLLPLMIVFSFCILDWINNFFTRLIYTHIPKVKLLAVCAPVLATFLSFLTCSYGSDSVDFSVIVVAMTSLNISVYALRGSIEKTCVAIVVQAVWFFVLAANLKNNTAAMVTIAVTATVLLLCLPKLTLFNGNESHTRGKTTVAVIILVFALLCTLMIEQTGTLEAFYTSSMGRPGLGSSTFLNQQCTSMLTQAKFVGPASLDYPVDGLFADRVLTYILAQGGWLAVSPILLSIVLLITSGIYLCHGSIAIQYYISVACLTVLTVQTVGYVLLSLSWDQLIFSEICPFLDSSGCFANTVFLLMAACILPKYTDGSMQYLCCFQKCKSRKFDRVC